jgi:hypothetical protein
MKGRLGQNLDDPMFTTSLRKVGEVPKPILDEVLARTITPFE